MFLGEGAYRGHVVRDDPQNSGAVITESSDVRRGNELKIDMIDGGGFVGRFSKVQ